MVETMFARKFTEQFLLLASKSFFFAAPLFHPLQEGLGFRVLGLGFGFKV